MNEQLDSLNQWIRDNGNEYEGKILLPLICCKDGLTLYIKVGNGAKSKPNYNIDKTDYLDYIQVEVPFLIKDNVYVREDLFSDFEIGKSGAYKNVPVCLVEQCIDLHGGRE